MAERVKFQGIEETMLNEAAIAAFRASLRGGPTSAKECWSALHPCSAGGAYLNFVLEEGEDRGRHTARITSVWRRSISAATRRTCSA